MANWSFVPSRAGDKAILEAAYRENPKPDKIARLDIVKRVSLNEKEVQASLPPNTTRLHLVHAPNTRGILKF